MSIRQPPPGWVEFRKCVTQKATNIYGEDSPLKKLVIKGIRSITTKNLRTCSLVFSLLGVKVMRV